MKKAGASGNHLSYKDTQVVKGMLNRGDRQHDIASYFGVNGGRIGEVSTGDSEYAHVTATPEEDLPPPGPYVTKYALHPVIATLNEAIEAIELAEAEDEMKNVRAALLLAKETIQNKIDSLEEA